MNFDERRACCANTFHLSLDVPDLDTRRRLLRAAVRAAAGQAQVRATPSSSWPTRRSLWLCSRPERPALSHLGIRVGTTDEVEGAGIRLRQSGLVTLDERDTACCYARQDKVWVADPAGNRWEVYTVLGDIEDDDDHEHAAEPTRQLRAARPSRVSPSACCA